MGGSQLKALKAQLKANGFVGQTNTKGKKKVAGSENIRDKEQRERVLKGIRDAFRPFDVKRSKPKVDVLGRKVDGSVGRPGKSKQTGEELRRRALKDDRANKNRVGGIMDTRFGENDPTLNPEQKMLERFAREKQIRASKSSLFNLEDSDEEDFQLTHFGQALSYDDYQENDEEDDEEHSDDDEETKALKEMRRKRKRLSEEAGITEDGEEPAEPAKKKTKQEAMKEVIAKSKYYKHERQLLKQKLDNEIENLDDQENFNELLGELRDAGSFKKNDDEIPDVDDLDDAEEKEKTKDEDYEIKVRELAFDRRGVASDRTKTEDEIAKEKAEKLKKLEAKRLARMNGEEVEDDDESDESEEENDDDDINDASEFGFKSSLDDAKEEEDDDEEVEGENDDLEGNYLVDDEFQQVDSDEEDSTEPATQKPKSASKDSKASKNSKIAYTFEMPECVEDLLEIFGKYPAQEQPVIVDRILTLYHPRLDPENKEKNSSFTNILAEYLMLTPELEPENEEEDVAPVLDQLIAILKKLADKHNESIAEFFREQLNKAENRLQAAISKNQNELVTETPSHLFLFTLVGILFSTSDHFNQVVTPASLLIGLHLSQVRLSKPADILAGLYIASTALTYQRISKRYIPEICIFLSRALYLLSPTELKGKSIPNDIFLGLMNPGKRFAASSGLTREKVSSKYSEPLVLRLLHTINETPKSERKDVYTRLYIKAMQVLESCMALWTDDSAFIEIFSPFVGMVKGYPPTLEKLEKRLKFAQKSRIPLTLQSHKPIPLASKIPKFEENYSVDKKSYDPDVVRRDHKKLQTLIKKERKGALRELRKDSQFLNREKLREQKQQYKSYHENIDRLIRTVATEEGAEKNKYERERRVRKKKH